MGMRQQLQQREQQLQQRSAAAKRETDAVHRQLREQRGRIQEQHAQLTMTQQQMRENIQDKTEYEQYVYREMLTVLGKCVLVEQRADIQAADHQ